MPKKTAVAYRIPPDLLARLTAVPAVAASLTKPLPADTWTPNLSALHRFLAAHSSWPSRRSADPAEVQVGYWLRRQREAAARGDTAFTVDRRSQLDAAAPGWDRVPVDEWDDLLADLAAFRTAYDRWPRSRAVDPAERVLGKWLQTQRSTSKSGRPRFTDVRRGALDIAAPGWDAVPAAAWPRQLSEVSDFWETHGRWPQKTSVDAVERSLSFWLSNQRSDASGGVSALTVERRAELDRMLPGWWSRACHISV